MKSYECFNPFESSKTIPTCAVWAPFDGLRFLQAKYQRFRKETHSRLKHSIVVCSIDGRLRVFNSEVPFIEKKESASGSACTQAMKDFYGISGIGEEGEEEYDEEFLASYNYMLWNNLHKVEEESKSELLIDEDSK